MFRLRDYGAPFLPGMDREFPCPICTAADVNGHAFPAVEIRHLWLTDRAGYDDLVMEATSGVY